MKHPLLFKIRFPLVASILESAAITDGVEAMQSYLKSLSGEISKVEIKTLQDSWIIEVFFSVKYDTKKWMGLSKLINQKHNLPGEQGKEVQIFDESRNKLTVLSFLNLSVRNENYPNKLELAYNTTSKNEEIEAESFEEDLAKEIKEEIMKATSLIRKYEGEVKPNDDDSYETSNPQKFGYMGHGHDLSDSNEYVSLGSVKFNTEYSGNASANVYWRKSNGDIFLGFDKPWPAAVRNGKVDETEWWETTTIHDFMMSSDVLKVMKELLAKYGVTKFTRAELGMQNARQLVYEITSDDDLDNLKAKAPKS